MLAVVISCRRELAHITKREAREGERLACQVAVKQDMDIEISPEMLETKKWKCKVRSNDSVADFIKELVLELPAGEEVDFKARRLYPDRGAAPRAQFHRVRHS